MSDGPEETSQVAGEPIARLTPYELVFGEGSFEATVFPQIQEEAELRKVDPLVPLRFDFLSRSGDAVREVVPVDAPPEALEQYRRLLYHAFNFWRSGKPVYVLDSAVARYLVEAAPTLADWRLTAPNPSTYLQLPANLFWGSISPDSTPEPVDGFFATAKVTDDPLGSSYCRIEILMVLGMRRDRAGFSVIPFSTEAGPGIADDWSEAPGRDDGDDFENTLPGGEMSGLYSILTTAEALKLVARSLWYIDSFPDDVSRAAAPLHRVSFGGDS
ncbi:MAG TPA: hypothetical protein VFI91_04680 [Longimicrobiaceae bacterium]|nr:hypothetical protein [Longimicrobiaceae bacterium]